MVNDLLKRLIWLALPLALLATACRQPVDVTVTPAIAPAPAVEREPPPTPDDALQAGAPATRVTLEKLLDGFHRPTYLTHAFDERLFVVEQQGRISIVQDGRRLTPLFLDISERVSTRANEQGLFSVAFHPDYPQNGYFFVNYTDNNGNTVIARYQVSAANPDLADPQSELILMTIGQPYGNHNGGQLKFGPDGYLYIGMGDGGSAGDPQNHGQNRSTLLGALLRIDVDWSEGEAHYAIPPDNPYLDDPAGRNEIWAIGLRNPWRFSFDRLTGDLYIADVGQNLWEEINFRPFSAPGGDNYGWNILEGSHCYRHNDCDPAGTILPVAEYTRDGGCSVTGGYVYRGERFPELYGAYFYADYCSGNIWSLYRRPDGQWVETLAGQFDLRIATFGEDWQGEIYLLDHAGGALYQLRP